MRVRARSTVSCVGIGPFPEIQFIRLTSWQESNRHTTLLGGEAFAGDIFLRFHLSLMKTVTLDFVSRGTRLCQKSADAFRNMVSHTRPVPLSELRDITEILREQAIKSATSQIEYAQVGDINGKCILAVCWTAANGKYRLMSLYYLADHDDRTIREIHFAAPVEIFASCQPALSDVMRSIQWKYEVPPVCVA